MVVIPGLIVLFVVLFIAWLALARFFKPIGERIINYLELIFKTDNKNK